MSIPLDDQIACAARELAMRRNVYPKWIANGKMKEPLARHELAAMEAVLATLNELRWIPVSERLPDDDETVMVATKGSFSEPVWLGWHTPDGWYAVGVVGAAQIEVTHWRPMPAGAA